MFLTDLNENLEFYVFTLINNFKSNINIDHLSDALQNLSRRQNDKEKLKSLIAKFSNKSFNNRFKPQKNDFKGKKNQKNKKKEKKCEHCKIPEHFKDKCYFLHSDIRSDD